MATTSCRAWPVYSPSARAKRALVPTRMSRLELRDLRFGPAVETGARLWLDRLHALCGIVSTQSDVDRVLHHRPQCLAQPVSTFRLVGAGRYHLDDVLALQRHDALVAEGRSVWSTSRQNRSMMFRQTDCVLAFIAAKLC